MNLAAAMLWPAGFFALGALAIVGVTLATVAWILHGDPPSRRRGLLREPACSLRHRLTVVNGRLVAAAVGAALTLFLGGVLFPAGLLPGDRLAVLSLYLVVGAVALGWYAREWFHYFPERRALIRAIDVQVRTAVSLNVLMRQKYWVLHDLHIGGHRINHLVVGPRGVFCVDSLWRRARGRLGWMGRAPAPEQEVSFDGEALRFPGWSERDVLAHADEQARWLGPWLAERTGESAEEIPTYGAIAIPGWRVVSTHWNWLMVFNPTTPNMLIEGAPAGRSIDPTTARAVLKALKQGQETLPEARVRHDGPEPEPGPGDAAATEAPSPES